MSKRPVCAKCGRQYHSGPALMAHEMECKNTPPEAASQELLPCPFCGAKAIYNTELDQNPPFGLKAWIKCPQCRQSQVCSDWYDGDLGIMEASWNTRTPPRTISPEQADEWRDKHIKKLYKRSSSLHSIALELVAHIRQYECVPELRIWANDAEKRVWEAEGLKDE